MYSCTADEDDVVTEVLSATPTTFSQPSFQRQAMLLHSFKLEERSGQHALMTAHTHAQGRANLFCTPPSAGRRTRTPFNPFNRNLMERLESATFSPSVFNHVISPRQGSLGEFNWTIDDVSRCMPAEIDESSVHLSDVDIDHETEQSAQIAIQRFFKTVKIPSPWQVEAAKHCSSPLPDTSTPATAMSTTSILSASVDTVERPSLKCTDVAVQTCWSFPPVLPAIVQELLKPYMQLSTNETDVEADQNLSTSTLRRKLDFTIHESQSGSERLMTSSSSNDSMTCDLEDAAAAGLCSPPVVGLAATPLQLRFPSPQDISPILTTRLNSFCQTPCRRPAPDEVKKVDVGSKMSICEMSRSGALDAYEDGCSLLDYNERQREGEGEQLSGSGSQDTGYQTQTIAEEKPTSGGSDGTMDWMAPWTESVLQACSTPTKHTNQMAS